MAFIETIAPSAAAGDVHAMYERQQAAYGYVPNYAKVFSHRPEVMTRWAALLSAIRREVEPRRFELVTFAAAHALRHSYCALAHGQALAALLAPAEVQTLASGGVPESLTALEAALVALARKVATDASSVTPNDIALLRAHGLADAEIFDAVAIAAARAFFTKLLDGLGVEADSSFAELEAGLREALTVGRPIATGAAERLDASVVR